MTIFSFDLEVQVVFLMRLPWGSNGVNNLRMQIIDSSREPGALAEKGEQKRSLCGKYSICATPIPKREAMLAAAKELNFERVTMLRDKMLAVKIPKSA